MRKLILISIVLLAAVPRLSYGAPKLTPNYVGELTVESMRQGNLLWLQGRVGEGRYRYNDEYGKTCTLKIPVVVGSMSGSGINISTISGMTISVISKRLNDALIHGERINNLDWNFSISTKGELDGLIVNGISEEESFILNSKNRWVSWLSGEATPSPICS
ncbi:hypothetical protein ACXJY6_17350 [Vibrio sp. RC27]